MTSVTGVQDVRFAPSDDPGVVLRGRLRRPSQWTGRDRAERVAVLCHPHPAFGGNMDVWLLPRIAQRLADEGWTSLRFDFRGAAQHRASADGAWERADLTGALAHLRARCGEPQQLAVVGWSFGALVALLWALEEPAVTHWVGVAPPTRPLAELPMPAIPPEVERMSARRIAIVGEHDQFFPPDGIDVVAPHELHILRDADHFLFDRDDEVAALVAASLRGS